MTKLVLEIETDEDLQVLTEIVGKMGIKYNIDEEDDYPEDLKKMLDEREDDYLNGKDVPLTAEESEKSVDDILSRIK